jgi:hypothetical protein
MNALNLANDNYGRGTNTSAPMAISPLSYQASGARQLLEAGAPMPAFIEAALSDLQGKTPMPSSDELTDAKIAGAEARTDTKIARMEGKLDLVVSKIDGINSRLDDVRHDYRATRANIWVVGLGLAVLIVGVAALFPVFFSVGTQIRDVIEKAIEAHISSSTPVPPRR